MKREILFRGKRIDNGEWVEGYYGVKGEGTDIEQHVIMQSTLSNGITNYFYFTDIEVISESVGQFTGLTDKNGVKIFEGDILKTSTEDIIEVRYEKIYASFGVWKKGWAFLHYFHESVEPEDCKVIGNIHDNPELLNQ